MAMPMNVKVETEVRWFKHWAGEVGVVERDVVFPIWLHPTPAPLMPLHSPVLVAVVSCF
jgi:hypothetical protein